MSVPVDVWSTPFSCTGDVELTDTDDSCSGPDCTVTGTEDEFAAPVVPETVTDEPSVVAVTGVPANPPADVNAMVNVTGPFGQALVTGQVATYDGLLPDAVCMIEPHENPSSVIAGGATSGSLAVMLSPVELPAVAA